LGKDALEREVERAPDATIAQAGERRSARIESLRALAALAVLFSHAFFLTNGYEVGAYRQRLALGLGEIGVCTFFALTGFLLFLPFARRDYGHGPRLDLRGYAINRAVRILPLYYTVLVIVVAVNGVTLVTAGKVALFMQNYDPRLLGRAVDGPMWSLVVELQFYVLLPFLAFALARLSRRSVGWASGCLLALAAASVLLLEMKLQPAGVWTDSFPARFQFFVPGMLLALFVARMEVPGRPVSLAHALARSDLCLLAALPFWLLAFVEPDVNLLPLGAVGSLLIVAASVLPLRRGRLDGVLDRRVLAVVGVASYSLYLWHYPVLEWLGPPAGGGLAAVLKYAAYGVPVCLAVAFVSYRLIEAPPLRLRRRWFVGSPASGGRERQPGLGRQRRQRAGEHAALGQREQAWADDQRAHDGRGRAVAVVDDAARLGDSGRPADAQAERADEVRTAGGAVAGDL
jgi:peptidoglycan/LPS O-acetylase OafA/YrhL